MKKLCYTSQNRMWLKAVCARRYYSKHLAAIAVYMVSWKYVIGMSVQRKTELCYRGLIVIVNVVSF